MRSGKKGKAHIENLPAAAVSTNFRI